MTENKKAEAIAHLIQSGATVQLFGPMGSGEYPCVIFVGVQEQEYQGVAEAIDMTLYSSASGIPEATTDPIHVVPDECPSCHSSILEFQEEGEFYRCLSCGDVF